MDIVLREADKTIEFTKKLDIDQAYQILAKNWHQFPFHEDAPFPIKKIVTTFVLHEDWTACGIVPGELNKFQIGDVVLSPCGIAIVKSDKDKFNCYAAGGRWHESRLKLVQR